MRTMCSLLLSASLAAVLLLLIWLVPVIDTSSAGASPTIAWRSDLPVAVRQRIDRSSEGVARAQEPVVVAGDQLPLFDGAALGDLFVYTYAGAGWQQIPVQLDEVDASGTYTVENGLLDADDELVLMAMDLGDQVTASNWITDTSSQSYLRYEIQVSDPLNPGQQGWAYVYRSATLSPALPADYVSWDAANQRLIGGTYAVGFNPAVHAAMDSMELNGSGVDALDRGKIRIDATCYVYGFPAPLSLTEEDLAEYADYTPAIDGPVRAGGGSTVGSSWAYHSLYRSHFTMNIDVLTWPPCTPLTINQIRLSSDWLDPTITGMAPATYYDNNNEAGVAIDGVPDSVPPSPVTTWKQVSGGQGSIVQVVDVSMGSGQLSNYYKDDETVDPNDTGDGRSFGDAGFVVEDPSGQIGAEVLTFFLDPNQPNLGLTYQSYYANPLEIVVTGQSHGPLHYVYLPLLAKDTR